MDNNVDINEEIKAKNRELLHKKRIIDLETAMESLILFYNNYSTKNIADDVNNYVCMVQKIDPNSQKGKAFYNTITTFFFLACEETKKIITSSIESIKTKLNDMIDQEYRENLKHLSAIIINQAIDYYSNKIGELYSEIIQTGDVKIRESIKKYLQNLTTVKMINILQENLANYIMVIGNNYEENNKVIQSINEKTINKGV